MKNPVTPSKVEKLILLGILATWAAHGPQWQMLIFLLAGIALATWGQAMMRAWLEPVSMLPYLDQGWEKNPGMQQEMYEKLRETEAASKEVMAVIDRMVREKHGD